jgi:hypothetical protein
MKTMDKYALYQKLPPGGILLKVKVGKRGCTAAAAALTADPLDFQSNSTSTI